MATEFGPLNALAFVQQQGELGRARGQQNRLAQLASQSYSAAPDEQAGILSQMAGIDPSAASAQQKQFNYDEDRRNKTLANMSSLLVNAAPRSRPGLYSQMLPSLQRMGIQAPAQYDASTAAEIDQTAQALYRAFSGAGSSASGVQSTYVDDQGQRVAIMRDGSTQVLGGNDVGANQQSMTIDINGTPTQVTFDRRTGRYTTANVGGGQPQQAQQGTTTFMGPDGMPIAIDPSVNPAMRDQITANPQSYNMLPDGSSAQITRDVSPQQFGTPLVGRRKEDEAAAVTTAQEAAKTGALAEQERIKNQAAIDRARGLAEVERTAEAAQNAPKKLQQYDQSLAAASSVQDSIKNALNMLGSSTTGFFGARLRGVEGSSSFNLASEIETVKANLGFDRLQQMRDNSPTGGALGAIAVQELVALQSTVANLDPNQSQEQIRRNLERVNTHYDNWVNAVTKARAELVQRSASQASSSATAAPAASSSYSNLWN